MSHSSRRACHPLTRRCKGRTAPGRRRHGWCYVSHMDKPRIYSMSVAKVYPMYVQKAEKKGRTKEEVDEFILWLTGYDQAGLESSLETEVDFETFFDEAPQPIHHAT